MVGESPTGSRTQPRHINEPKQAVEHGDEGDKHDKHGRDVKGKRQAVTRPCSRGIDCVYIRRLHALFVNHAAGFWRANLRKEKLREVEATWASHYARGNDGHWVGAIADVNRH